jgi:prepilin-type N-terminal cleavage/methylation domain-containing protein
MFPIYKYNKSKKGLTVVELLVVIAISAVALTSLLGLASFSLGVSTLIKHTNQANNLAQETMEAVRNFREGTGWNTQGLGKLATSTDYFPQATGTPQIWQLILGKETVDIFERKVIFEDVLRDGNNNIVASDGTFDPDTKKVTAIVSWSEKGGIKQIKLVTYLTNWKK